MSPPVVSYLLGRAADQNWGVADLPLRSQIEQLSTPLWVFDVDHSRVVWANQAGLEVWNADTLSDLIGRDLRLDMSVSVATRLKQYQEDFEKRGATFSELWTLYPKGKPKTLRIVYSGIKLPDGRIGMFCEGTPYDAETPETLRSAEALLHANVMISLYNKFGEPLYRNPAARADAGDSDGSLILRFVDQEDHRKLRASLDRMGEARIVARVRAANGVRWHEITARECSDAVTGSPAMLISEVDVSDLKQAEEKAHFLALHDVLTGLKNRTFVQQEFHGILSGADKRGEFVGLLFIDIDRFKNINDSLGHAVGDELLIEVARRLRASVRETDIVARAGGDEFLVLFREAVSREYLGDVAARIRDDLSRPVTVETRELQVTASIGVSVFPIDGTDIETLMKSADLALYQAKEAGRNCHIFFRPTMKERVETRTRNGDPSSEGFGTRRV